jgi:hypothetical protein
MCNVTATVENSTAILQKKLKIGQEPVAHACHPSYSGGRITIRRQPGQIVLKILSQKNTQHKKGLTQVEEHLPSKHEVLSSNKNGITK